MICLNLLSASGKINKNIYIIKNLMNILLHFLYSFYTILFISADSYDENVNIRSFGYDAMWGSIGGYVVWRANAFSLYRNYLSRSNCLLILKGMETLR